MTQDAPLDQKALEAAYKVYQRIGFVPNIEHVEASIRAYLAALFPASGGEAEPPAVALLRGPLSKRATSAEFNEWQAREVVAYIDRLRAASPIVAAPEGWWPVPVDDDSRDFANSALPIEMIHAGMDALEKVDEDNRNYVAGETIDWDNGMVAVAVYRAMLSAAPSIPEGKAGAPEGWTPEKYAEQLAVSLREKHYPEAPQFEPMTGNIMGLLSQIDNMVVGLVRATAPEGKAEGGADRRPANCRNRLHDEGKAHPKSGCAVCKTGGITGCPYERPIPEGKAEPQP